MPRCTIPDDWREPFRVFIKALQEESLLNLTGRIRTRSEILMMLEARLRIEDCYRHAPEIDEEQIVRPLIVVGQGRSGTSFLQNTLAADPDNGTLMHWEALFPCPPPEAATYHSDSRIALANRRIDQWNRVTPELASMHEFAGDIPTEECAILALNFMWSDSEFRPLRVFP
jgi:Sulfotransferase family